MAQLRSDHSGPHRAAYEKNKRRVIATGNTCGICGGDVDKSLKVPDPMSACVDHIIPIAKGGHPSALDNLQLAHAGCNRQKSDKIFKNMEEKKKMVIGNRNLPQSMDWATYRANNEE